VTALPLLPGLLLLLCACAGVFVNPDIAGGRQAGPNQQEIALCARDNREDRVIQAIADTGTARFPERDYYWLQNHFAFILRQFHTPGSPQTDPDIDYMPPKDITRLADRENPRFDSLAFLQNAFSGGYSLYVMRACPAAALVCCVQSNLPVLIFGTLTFKWNIGKRALVDAGGQKTIFRKFDSFDIVYGYQKLTGLSQRLPGQSDDDEYMFLLRSKRNFKAGLRKLLSDRAVSLYGGAPVGSNWWIHDVFMVLPEKTALDSVEARLEAAGAGLGQAQLMLPALEKVF
jgi:hypothetical protein